MHGEEEELESVMTIRVNPNMKKLIAKLAEEDESTSSEVTRNLIRIGLNFVYGDVSGLLDKIDEERRELTERLRYLDEVKEKLLRK